MAGSAVLTASAKIEADAGETVSFAIALDGTDGVPSRSIIAIKGLPQHSNFSEGRPFGDGEWVLKPDQIGDLHLVLPAGATGEFKLGIVLIAPDHQVIAEADTLLAIAPQPAPPGPAVGVAGNIASPSEPAATAVISDGSEAAVAVAPDPEISEDAEPTEAAIATRGVTQPENVDKGAEQATTPASGAQPNMLGQAETGETGLGTVEPSVFVNLRDRPSSSSPVLGVVAKGTKLPVLDRKRGWVQVTDPASGKQGWIYGGLLAGEAKPHYRRKRAAPADAETEMNSESFWGRVGRWLTPG